MKRNVGFVDRIFRGIMALLVIVLILTKTVQGGTAIIFGVMAVVLLFTSTTRFCPCYMRFNIDTAKNKKEE